MEIFLVWLENAVISPPRISDANFQAVDKRLFPSEVFLSFLSSFGSDFTFVPF
jgi:hypothetical protein